jgi:hypothetical protein
VVNGYSLKRDKGSKAVMAMLDIPIEGNIVPMSWFTHITYPNGKPNANAVLILADIVYWYRPIEIRDERTSKVVGYAKKFEGEWLQRTHKEAGEVFGFTPKQAKDAIDCLERHGVIRKHIATTVITKSGKALGNVPYIELVPARLREITTPLISQTPRT